MFPHRSSSVPSEDGRACDFKCLDITGPPEKYKWLGWVAGSMVLGAYCTCSAKRCSFGRLLPTNAPLSTRTVYLRCGIVTQIARSLVRANLKEEMGHEHADRGHPARWIMTILP